MNLKTFLSKIQSRGHQIFFQILGDPRHFPLEHRLVNAITSLNGVINLLGAFSMGSLPRAEILVPLHLGFGALFLFLFYLSRVRKLFQPIYWPFLFLMVTFLSINILWNAGSLGGAHYYLIPALVIGIVISPNLRKKIAALTLFVFAGGILFAIERFQPTLIYGHTDLAAQRWLDVSGNFLFVQLFTGMIVMILAKNLEEERLKSDRLLLNILPESIAEELKKTDRVLPHHYETATVMFTDFVGFTQSAEVLPAQSLVTQLDECFRAFDAITRRNGLEKIKTIGDAYMAAAGVPHPSSSHAHDCVRAALEIRDFMLNLQESRTEQQQPHWELRLGIHTGPLVAGVVGTDKFVYDIWGDTVNTAARMESSGVVGKVNISGATHSLIKDQFQCEHRGKIAAKNKGEVDMYIVLGDTDIKREP